MSSWGVLTGRGRSAMHPSHHPSFGRLQVLTQPKSQKNMYMNSYSGPWFDCQPACSKPQPKPPSGAPEAHPRQHSSASSPTSPKNSPLPHLLSPYFSADIIFAPKSYLSSTASLEPTILYEKPRYLKDFLPHYLPSCSTIWLILTLCLSHRGK